MALDQSRTDAPGLIVSHQAPHRHRVGILGPLGRDPGRPRHAATAWVVLVRWGFRFRFRKYALPLLNPGMLESYQLGPIRHCDKLLSMRRFTEAQAWLTIRLLSADIPAAHGQHREVGCLPQSG